jgi:predicted metal-dependent HD superfamily phosphohydrolase
MSKSYQQRWHELWRRLGCQSSPDPWFQELLAAYTGADRFYHSWEHVLDCLGQLDQAGVVADYPDEIEMALWCHDFIYQPHATDNEEQSAAWARQALTTGLCPEAVIVRVSDLILATRHQAAPGSPDAALIVDIDLSILGRSEPEYESYEARIRQEYIWVPELIYRVERGKVLRLFLQRLTIYQTSTFQARYEQRARENLKRTIRALAG